MGSVFENDRQRFKRFPPNVAIRFRRLDLSGAQKELKTLQATIAAATNVSDLGVFISTADLLPSESVLELIFTFEPQGREVKSLARVSWSSPDRGKEGMGVELIKVSQELYSSIITRAKRGNWIEVEREE